MKVSKNVACWATQTLRGAMWRMRLGHRLKKLYSKDSDTWVQAGLTRTRNVRQSGRKDTGLALHLKMTVLELFNYVQQQID